MCGIAGVLFQRPVSAGARHNQPPPAFCAQLVRSLSARGPDGHGVFVDDGVALVHTRLSLVDLAGGQQPISTADGRHVLIVNGEVYNHQRLRPLLEARGARFRTRSDSEVLLWALALDGAEGLASIEGEYAFCFWDRVERRALLGRDTLGVKPLIVTEHEGALWFASELKALLAVLPERRKLDVTGVVEGLVAPALSGAERTPFVGFTSLAPGSTLSVRESEHRVVRHEPFTFRDQRTDVQPEQLRAALAQATCDRLSADVEVGAFLSGGVDSSALVAAGIEGRTGLQRCLTIRFDHHTGAAAATSAPGSIVVGDDAPFADALAQRWPIQLTRVHASRTALLAELDSLAATQDRMVAWEQELSQRFLARAAAHELKAVLVGDAADETHFGYAFALSPEVSASPLALLSRFGFGARRALLRPALWPIADALDAEYRALTAQAGFVHGTNLRQNRLATGTLLVKRWLPRLLHNGDIHCMAFGLEARVPFADRRVLAVAARVAVDDAFSPLHGQPEKAFLRTAVSPWLPHEIVARPKSALPRDDGMGPLFQQHLRDLLGQPLARERLSGWLELGALDALLVGEPDDTRRACLFSVLTLEAFLRHHAG